MTPNRKTLHNTYLFYYFSEKFVINGKLLSYTSRNMPETKAIEDQDFYLFLQRIKQKDERAWNDLQFVLKRILFRWLLKKGINVVDVTEIYNNTMVVFLEKLNDLQFENYSLLKSYIFAVADRKVKEYYRQNNKAKLSDTVEKVQEHDYTGFLFNDTENNDEILQKVYRFIEKLPLMEMRVLTVLYKDGKSQKEAAGDLKLSEGNLRVIKHRALNKIKTWLNKK